MTTAAVRAKSAAVTTCLETIEALYCLSCCVIVGSTARAFGAHVEFQDHGLQFPECGGEIIALNWVIVGGSNLL